MDYKNSYKTLADKIRSQAMQPVEEPTQRALVSKKPKDEGISTGGNVQEHYMSMVRQYFGGGEEEAKNEIEAYLDPEPISKEAPEASVRPKAKPVPVADMDDREMLAKTIQAEAGNQDYKGKLAVGEVIANRVGKKRYGEDLKSVIMKPGQFSAWNSVTGYAGGEQGQDMNKMRPSKEAYAAADAIIKGDYEPITNGATNYYAIIPGVSEKPSWSNDSFGTKIGDHYFGKA